MFCLTKGLWLFPKIVLCIINSRKTATNVAHTIERARIKELGLKVTTIQQKHFKITKNYQKFRTFPLKDC